MILKLPKQTKTFAEIVKNKTQIGMSSKLGTIYLFGKL